MLANEYRDRLVAAALPHVTFDGWSETSFRMACADAGISIEQARAFFPRGAADLAIAWHRSDDEEMARRLKDEDLSSLRFRDRIARAILLRLEGVDREAMRRSLTLFALPHHAGDGARAIWATADTIWTALGDRSDDFNWYSKRTSLSAVYGTTTLIWLGDNDEGLAETRAFLDRRINGVMRFEKLKKIATSGPQGWLMRKSPLGRIAQRIQPPAWRGDLPGSFGRRDADKGPAA